MEYNYITQETAMEIYTKEVDSFLEYANRKEKHDFIIRLGVILLVFFWLFGYYLFPPVRNSVQGDGNMVQTENSDMYKESDN